MMCLQAAPKINCYLQFEQAALENVCLCECVCACACVCVYMCVCVCVCVWWWSDTHKHEMSTLRLAYTVTP